MTEKLWEYIPILLMELLFCFWLRCCFKRYSTARFFNGTGSVVRYTSAYTIDVKTKFIQNSHKFKKGLLDDGKAETFIGIDKAILPKWPESGISKIDKGYGVKIPRGTLIHEGGGTQQVLIEEPWKLKGVEVVEQFSLKKDQIWQNLMK